MKHASLNHAYRLVWSEVQQVFVAVAAFVRSADKKGGAVTLLAPTLLLAATAQAAPGANELPTGGTVVGGSTTINTSGSRMDVLQTTQRSAIDWNTFNIGSAAQVHFNQPAGGAVLNRVLNSNASQIYGKLTSTGQVFLVNPNGVLFAPGAQVDVGGLVASTLPISKTDFMAGNTTFAGDSASSIVNQGNISAPGGTIALIAARIINQGSLAAEKGNVLLGSGSRVTLDLGGAVKLVVEQGALDALVEQGGVIKADGGLVYLTAKAANAISNAVINHTGITEARTLATGEQGQIYLLGDMAHGQVNVSGTLDASAPHGGGDGGFIETSAARVNIADGVRVDTRATGGKTGQWLIDPVDITIASSGGDITGATIATALQTTDVTLDAGTGTCTGAACGALGGTGGNITVNDNITVAGGSADTTLTLKASGDINLNASKSINRTGSYKLNTVLWADSDASGSGSIYLKDSSSVSTNGGHVWLGGGATSSTAWNGLTVGDGYALAGTIHSINGSNFKNGISLYKANINSGGGNIKLYGKTDTQSGAAGGYMGVYLEQSTISSGSGNIDLSAISTGSNNDGSWHYGLLMGTLPNSTTTAISSTSGTINVTGETSFGENTYGSGVGLYSFGNARSTVKIQSTSGAINITGKLNSTGYNGQYGGIYFYGSGQEMIVSESGNISLDGYSANSNVASINFDSGNTTANLGYDGTNAYTGNITLKANTFANYNGAIYANALNLTGSGVTYSLTNTSNNINSLTSNTGNVTYVDSNEMSLGANTVTGKLNVATASGDLTVDGNQSAGSTATDAIVLNAGKNTAAGTSTGGNIIVSSGTISTGAGGRATLYSGSVSDSTGLTTLVGSGSGKFRYNSDETATNYSTALGSGVHTIYREQPTVTVAVNSTSKTYDGAEYSGNAGASTSGFVNGDTSAALTGSLTYGGAAQGAVNAGSYAITASGYGNGLGYGISYANGTLTINKANLTVTADNQTRLYGGANPTFTQTITGFVNGENASTAGVTGSATGSSTATTTTGVGSYTITGGTGTLSAANYDFTSANGTLTINKRPITVTADAKTKTYGDTDPSLSYSVTSGSLVGSDTLSVALTRAAGENAGTYTINAWALANGNYLITANNGTLTINKRPITVTADNKSKTSGAAEPKFTYQVTSGSLVGTDTLTGALTRPAGEKAGTYVIDASALANGNYLITANNGTLTIAAASVPVVSSQKPSSLFQNQLWWFGTPNPDPPPSVVLSLTTPLAELPDFKKPSFQWFDTVETQSLFFGLSTYAGRPGQLVGQAPFTIGPLQEGDETPSQTQSQTESTVSSLANSQLASQKTGNTSLIQQSYVAHLGRPADPAGLAFWERKIADEIASGRSTEAVLAEMDQQLAEQAKREGPKPSDAINAFLFTRPSDQNLTIDEGFTFSSGIVGEALLNVLIAR